MKRSELDKLNSQSLYSKLLSSDSEDHLIKDILRRRYSGGETVKFGNDRSNEPWETKSTERRQTNATQYWPSDRKAAEDFHNAVIAFRRDGPEFWDDDTMEKDWEETDGFLEGLEDREYDDLTAGEKRFFGFIRNTHTKWIKSQLKG